MIFVSQSPHLLTLLDKNQKVCKSALTAQIRSAYQFVF